MTDLTPPGPPQDEPDPSRRTGPLPVDEWIDQRRADRERETGDAPATFASPAYGRFPVAPTQPPPSKSTAGWALGLSIADCCGIGALVGIGLGIKVLREGRDGRDHGNGLAIAAIIIGAIRTLLLVAYVAALALGATGALDDVDTADPQVGDHSGSGWISNQDLERGDCFNDDQAHVGGRTEVHVSGTVKLVPCGAPHQFETYLSFQMPAGDYPGRAAVQRAAGRCVPEFQSYVGTPWRPHEGLGITYYFPTESNWDRTRRITCNIDSGDGHLLTGSVRGTGAKGARGDRAAA